VGIVHRIAAGQALALQDAEPLLHMIHPRGQEGEQALSD
jgi:hypothetical protein